MSEITLSILTPNFNDGHLLVERLKKMLPVIPEDVEYVICDDCSTDDSRERLRAAIQDHPQVRFLQNEQNLGVIASYNNAARHACGRYIYFSSANDELMHEKLFQLLPLLRKTSAGCVVTDIVFRYLCEEREDEHQILAPDCVEPTFFSPEEVVVRMNKTFFWVPGSSALLRRDLCAKHDDYLPHLGHFTDFFLNQICALEEGVLYVPKGVFTLFLVREQSFSIGCSFSKRLQLGWKMIKEIEKLDPEVRSRVARSGIFSHTSKWVAPALLSSWRRWKLLFYMIRRKLHLSRLKRTFQSVY